MSYYGKDPSLGEDYDEAALDRDDILALIDKTLEQAKELQASLQLMSDEGMDVDDPLAGMADMISTIEHHQSARVEYFTSGQAASEGAASYADYRRKAAREDAA